MSSSIRVLVVDDHEPWRRFVGIAFTKHHRLQVVGEASDGLEAVQKAQELQPDLVLLDMGLPTLNGIESALRIQDLVPAAKILFVSQNSDPDVIGAALRNGASGYLLKIDAMRGLFAAVEAVIRGDRFVSKQLKG